MGKGKTSTLSAKKKRLKFKRALYKGHKGPVGQRQDSLLSKLLKLKVSKKKRLKPRKDTKDALQPKQQVQQNVNEKQGPLLANDQTPTNELQMSVHQPPAPQELGPNTANRNNLENKSREDAELDDSEDEPDPALKEQLEYEKAKYKKMRKDDEEDIFEEEELEDLEEKEMAERAEMAEQAELLQDLLEPHGRMYLPSQGHHEGEKAGSDLELDSLDEAAGPESEAPEEPSRQLSSLFKLPKLTLDGHE